MIGIGVVAIGFAAFAMKDRQAAWVQFVKFGELLQQRVALGFEIFPLGSYYYVTLIFYFEHNAASGKVEEIMMKWSRWVPFPDPQSGGFLKAPFGLGVYELRDRETGNLILYGMSKNVSTRMSSLLPNPPGTGTRKHEKTGLRQRTHNRH